MFLIADCMQPLLLGIQETLSAHRAKCELLSQLVRVLQDLYKECLLPAYFSTLRPFAALKLHVPPSLNSCPFVHPCMPCPFFSGLCATHFSCKARLGVPFPQSCFCSLFERVLLSLDFHSALPFLQSWQTIIMITVIIS